METDRLLPDRDFELKRRFGKGEIASFFSSRDYHSRALAERRDLSASKPATSTDLTSKCLDLLEETIALASSPPLPESLDFSALHGLNPDEKRRLLGRFWEANFLLTNPCQGSTKQLENKSTPFLPRAESPMILET
ncbi:MAG: hypothetical protein ACJAVK_000581 [Akkermansiaceae bacterium]